MGVGGDRTKRVNQRLETEFRHRGELRNRTPDEIVLSVGVNDTALLGRQHGRHYTELHLPVREISSLLDRAQERTFVLFWPLYELPAFKTAQMPFMKLLLLLQSCRSASLQGSDATRLRRTTNSLLGYLLFVDGTGASLEAIAPIADGLHPNVAGDGVELGIASQPSHSKPDLRLSPHPAPGWWAQDMGGQWLSYLSLLCLVKFRLFMLFRISDKINAWHRGVRAGESDKTHSCTLY
ncbi:MAG: hypothetical protein GDA56_16895 [Hormoscilla sp. GM7CHS1pb]|nr:hypothetical protein [Hormoscilla sp. GM7CHS1pb]